MKGVLTNDVTKQGVRAVVFDLDGTLLDTLDDLAASTNWALRYNGLPERTTEEVRSFVGNGVRRLIERAVPDGELHPLFGKVYDDFRQHYVAHCQERTRLYDGIGSLLQALRQRGYRLAIVSNKLQAGVTALHQAYFADLIEVAVGERPDVRRKPAPDMVHTALRELGVVADAAVYVGDSDVDVATAQASGLPCVSVTWGFRSRSFLIEHGATVLIDRPDELLQWLEVRD